MNELEKMLGEIVQMTICPWFKEYRLPECSCKEKKNGRFVLVSNECKQHGILPTSSEGNKK